MFERTMAAGITFLTVEPVNEMTAYDFPLHSVVCIADENPGAFQNLDKILGAAAHVILCELPIIPKDDTLLAAAQDGRTVLITCTSESLREWLAHCQPHGERLLAIGTGRLQS